MSRLIDEVGKCERESLERKVCQLWELARKLTRRLVVA